MSESLLSRVSSRTSLTRIASTQSIQSMKSNDQDHDLDLQSSDDEEEEEEEDILSGAPIDSSSPSHAISPKINTNSFNFVNPMPQLQGHLLVFVRWRGWIKRTVQLINGEILVSVLQRSLVKRHIKLTSTCKLEDSSARPFCFSIISTSTSSEFEPILFAADNVSAKEAWTDAIQTTLSFIRIKEREKLNEVARALSSDSHQSRIPFTSSSPPLSPQVNQDNDTHNDYLNRPIIYFKIHRARNLVYREVTQVSSTTPSSILSSFNKQPSAAQPVEEDPLNKQDDAINSLPPSSYIKLNLGSSTVRTTTRRKDANPEWGMIFPFDWNSNLRYAHIEVWDEREGESYDELLGSVAIPLLSLCVKPHPPKFYSLGKESSKLHAQGEVEIEITWSGGNVLIINQEEEKEREKEGIKSLLSPTKESHTSSIPPSITPSEYSYMKDWQGLGGREQLFSWLFFLLIHNIGTIQQFNFSPSISSSYHLPLASSIDGDGQVSIRNTLRMLSENSIKVPLMGFPLQYPCIELEDLEDLILNVEIIISYNNNSVKIRSNGILMLTSLRLIFISIKKIFIDSNLYNSTSSPFSSITSNLSNINIHKNKFKSIFDPLFDDDEKDNEEFEEDDDSEDEIFCDDTLDEEDISHENYLSSIISVHLTSEYDSVTGNTYEGLNIKTIDGKKILYIFKDSLDNSILQMYIMKLYSQNIGSQVNEKQCEKDKEENLSHSYSNSDLLTDIYRNKSNEDLQNEVSSVAQSPSISSIFQKIFKKDEKSPSTPSNYNSSSVISSVSALRKIVSSQVQIATPASKSLISQNSAMTSMIASYLINSTAPLEKWWGHLLCLSDGSYPLTDPYYTFSFPYLVENQSDSSTSDSKQKKKKFSLNTHDIKIKVNENYIGSSDFLDDPPPHRFYRRLRYYILNRDILRKESLLLYNNLLNGLKEACGLTLEASMQSHSYDQADYGIQIDLTSSELNNNDNETVEDPSFRLSKDDLTFANIPPIPPLEERILPKLPSPILPKNNPIIPSLIPTCNSLSHRVKNSLFLIKNFTKLFFNIENSWYLFDPYKEFRRQGALSSSIWRISRVNESFNLCPSYPSIHLVPASINDNDIIQAANFRSKNRFPTISWISQESCCCIARSSQPLVGMTNNRNEFDEKIIKALNPRNETQDSSNESNPPLLIVDARPLLNARANQAVGKGVENKKNYENVDIIFMDIPNIHTIRKSYENLYEALYNNTEISSSSISTSWIQHIYKILHAVSCITYYVLIEKRSILIHCSDGWDRTSQLVSLSMFLMDPFYHTLEGFIILIEKEWINFGHKFICRYAWNSNKSWNNNEKSPIFLQFLECVHIFLLKYPNMFEFNERLLIFLADHAYLGFYANFLFNNERERYEANPIESNLISIWTVILGNKKNFLNKNYRKHFNKNKNKNVIFKDFFKNVEINLANGSSIPFSSLQSHLFYQQQQQQLILKQQQQQQQLPLYRQPSQQLNNFFFSSLDILRINTNRHNYSLWTNFYTRFIDKSYQFGWSQADCNTLGLKKLQYNLIPEGQNPSIYSRINNFMSRNNLGSLNKNPGASPPVGGGGTTTGGTPLNVTISNWKEDREAIYCTSCFNKFSLFRRKHHCRNCGDIFCDLCSSFYRVIPRINPIQPLRCCENCSISIDSEAMEATLRKQNAKKNHHPSVRMSKPIHISLGRNSRDDQISEEELNTERIKLQERLRIEGPKDMNDSEIVEEK